MPFTAPTEEEVLEIILAGVNTWLPELDTVKGTKEWQIFKTIAHAITSSMGNAEQLNRDVNPLYATGDALSNLASLWGLNRTEATISEDGVITVGVSGTGAWLITQNFTSPDGLTFVATTGGTWTASDSTVLIPLESVSTGAATNKAVGAALTVTSPPAGMAATGVISTGFTTAGLDEETDGELRARLSNLFQGVANSGNRGDYVRWMEEVSGVAEGFVYGELRNSLSLDGVPFGPASVPGSRWVTAAVVTAVENYINGTASTDGTRAVGQDFDGVLPTAQNQAVDVTITSDTNYGRDWGDVLTTTIPNASIDSVLADGTAVIVSIDPEAAPRNIAIGDRVALNVRTASSATHYHLEVRTVTNITKPAANWYLWLDTPLSSTTYAGDLYPAGPTTEATVTAIEAAFDALGPADDSTSSRWPLVSSEYPCDLNLAETNRRIMDVEVEGVRRHQNTTWTLPLGVDVVATPSTITGGVLVANTIRLTTCRIQYTNLNN
jgi:hypothetical protein